jgi:hypothetical protein
VLEVEALEKKEEDEDNMQMRRSRSVEGGSDEEGESPECKAPLIDSKPGKFQALSKPFTHLPSILYSFTLI